MKKYRVSRFKQLIFPKELIIDKFHVLSRKRHFPAFWRVTEESIPLSKVASIQVYRGMFFSKLIIENAGGPYPIIVDGLWNKLAREARDLLEMIEREMMRREDIGYDGYPGGGSGGGASGGGGSGREPSDPSGTHRESRSASGPSSEDAHIKEMAKEILRGTPEKTKNNAAPPQASHNNPVEMRSGSRSVYQPIENVPPPQFDPPQDSTASRRRVGDIPHNWQPTPPWNPKEKTAKSPVIDSEYMYPVIDPVEFLNSAAEEEHIDPQVSVMVIDKETEFAEPVKKESVKRKSAIDQLTNWWDHAKQDIQSASRPSRRKRRKLK